MWRDEEVVVRICRHQTENVYIGYCHEGRSPSSRYTTVLDTTPGRVLDKFLLTNNLSPRRTLLYFRLDE